jgi:hypothetical protein
LSPGLPIGALVVICSPHYTQQDAATSPGPYAALYDDLPRDPAQLRDIVSRLIVHVSRAASYGLPSGTPMSRDTLVVADRLKLTQALSCGSLLDHRAADKRSFGTCRDFALVLCSMLRHQSVPARIRCGFATYFTAGPYQDHWICEYWSASASRWIRLDAQLDAPQRDRLAITCDCGDLQDEAFVSAGQAWTLARSGRVSPEAFAHGDAGGWWFLRVNVHRDLFALTNQCMSRWDSWRLSTPATKALRPADMAAVDRLVAQSEAIDLATGQFGALKATAARCQVPPWQS